MAPMPSKISPYETLLYFGVHTYFATAKFWLSKCSLSVRADCESNEVRSVSLLLNAAMFRQKTLGDHSNPAIKGQIKTGHREAA